MSYNFLFAFHFKTPDWMRWQTRHISKCTLEHDDKMIMHKLGYKLINHLNYCLLIYQHKNYVIMALLLCKSISE